MDDTLVEPEGSHEPHRPKTPRQAAISAWIGTALEYYDFFIYGTAAALVFPKVFFPAGNPAAATIASLATFGAAYAARPIGSLIMGHLGDTIGRKRVLVITLFGMGVSTFLIGLLPTYAQVGVAAPILLLILRLCQGIFVAGEGPSAAATSLEHSPAHRRAFFTSFSQAGAHGGNILASAAFLAVAALLPEPALLSWGWRIPFLLSAVVVLVGWWIRRSLHESPAFEEEQEHHDVPKAPLKVLFKNYTPDVVKIVFVCLAGVNSTLLSQYALTYGVNTMGLPRSLFLGLVIVTASFALIAIPLFGILSDRIGRKPVLVAGVLLTGATVWPFLWAISEKNIPLIWLFGILLIGVFHSGWGGAIYALCNEQFDTRVRMSGTAVGVQFGLVLTGFAPAIAAALAGPNLTSWVPVAVLGSGSSLLAALAALTMRETHKTHLYDLGKSAGRGDVRVQN
jgi:MFS family permease